MPSARCAGMTIRPMLADPVTRAEVARSDERSAARRPGDGRRRDVDIDARIAYAARLRRRQDLDAAGSRTRSRAGARADSRRYRSSSRSAMRSTCRTSARSYAALRREATSAIRWMTTIGELQRRRPQDRAALSRARNRDRAGAVGVFSVPLRRLALSDARLATWEPRRRRECRGYESNARQGTPHPRSRDRRGASATTMAASFAAKWIGRNRYVYGRFREGMRLFVRGRVERTLAGASRQRRAVRVARRRRRIPR